MIFLLFGLGFSVYAINKCLLIILCVLGTVLGAECVRWFENITLIFSSVLLRYI